VRQPPQRGCDKLYLGPAQELKTLAADSQGDELGMGFTGRSENDSLNPNIGHENHQIIGKPAAEN